jgi:hypothetical protein
MAEVFKGVGGVQGGGHAGSLRILECRQTTPLNEGVGCLSVVWRCNKGQACACSRLWMLVRLRPVASMRHGSVVDGRYDAAA